MTDEHREQEALADSRHAEIVSEARDIRNRLQLRIAELDRELDRVERLGNRLVPPAPREPWWRRLWG